MGETLKMKNDNILIAYFSWSGNVRRIAAEIQRQTGATLFEIKCKTPYSNDYNTVLEEAKRDQMAHARPALSELIENMDAYDTIILGYPNWWSSIPMPVATFLDAYDFAGKSILPFCSHGGGGIGRSVADIAKLASSTRVADGLAVHSAGGTGMPGVVSEWLTKNSVK